MKRSCLILALASALLLGFPAISMAWDTYFDGSQLPTQEGWTFGGTDTSQCSTDGDALRILDNGSNADAYFLKVISSYGQPITSQARVRVAGASDLGSVFLHATNGKVGTLLSFFPGELRISFGWGPDTWLSFPADFSSFHTVRVAIDSQDSSFVWLDGELLAEGVAHSSQGAMIFGAYSVPGTSDSYWDYVAASPEFLPIPEPSSLLALGGGVMGLAGLAVRRRRR